MNYDAVFIEDIVVVQQMVGTIKGIGMVLTYVIHVAVHHLAAVLRHVSYFSSSRSDQSNRQMSILLGPGSDPAHRATQTATTLQRALAAGGLFVEFYLVRGEPDDASVSPDRDGIAEQFVAANGGANAGRQRRLHAFEIRKSLSNVNLFVGLHGCPIVRLHAKPPNREPV